MTEQKELLPHELMTQVRARLETMRKCNGAMCTHCIDILCEDILPMVDLAISRSQPAENERVKEVINFVAFWRGLYAHYTNVEEGNYLRCLRCNGESQYHGRDLDPKDVIHAETCPVAVAQELVRTSLLPVQPAASMPTDVVELYDVLENLLGDLYLLGLAEINLEDIYADAAKDAMKLLKRLQHHRRKDPSIAIGQKAASKSVVKRLAAQKENAAASTEAQDESRKRR